MWHLEKILAMNKFDFFGCGEANARLKAENGLLRADLAIARNIERKLIAHVASVEKRWRGGLEQYAKKENWAPVFKDSTWLDRWAGEGEGPDLARSLLSHDETPAQPEETDTFD